MSLVDVSELMSDPAFSRTVTLRRPNAPTFANHGVASVTYAADVSIVAIVQPATAADMQMLPEGAQLSEMVAIWSATHLIAAEESGVGSDIIVDGAKSYRVIKAEDWSEHGYYSAWAQRFDP